MIFATRIFSCSHLLFSYKTDSKYCIFVKFPQPGTHRMWIMTVQWLNRYNGWRRLFDYKRRSVLTGCAAHVALNGESLFKYHLSSTTRSDSRLPSQVPVEKNLSCGEICPHDRLSGKEILHMTDCHVEEILRMRNVKKMSRNTLWFVIESAILLQNNFFAKYAVLS